MREIREASVPTGGWLDGDHGGDARRGVTLLERSAWEAACAAVGKALPWWSRRANVFVEGLDLPRHVGACLQVGGVRLEIGGLVDPCAVMDAVHPGLRRALDRDGRGGAYGRVIEGGTLQIGDHVEVVACGSTTREDRR